MARRLSTRGDRTSAKWTSKGDNPMILFLEDLLEKRNEFEYCSEIISSSIEGMCIRRDS